MYDNSRVPQTIKGCVMCCKSYDSLVILNKYFIMLPKKVLYNIFSAQRFNVILSDRFCMAYSRHNSISMQTNLSTSWGTTWEWCQKDPTNLNTNSSILHSPITSVWISKGRESLHFTFGKHPRFLRGMSYFIQQSLLFFSTVCDE